MRTLELVFKKAFGDGSMSMNNKEFNKRVRTNNMEIIKALRNDLRASGLIELGKFGIKAKKNTFKYQINFDIK